MHMRTHTCAWPQWGIELGALQVALLLRWRLWWVLQHFQPSPLTTSHLLLCCGRRTYSNTEANFDKDRDGFVVKSEFVEGMTELKCCGSYAPFWCHCEPYAFRVFPPVDTNLYDRFELSVSNFITNLVSSNFSRFLGSPTSSSGGCYQSVQASVGSGVPAGSMKLQSMHGEVIVTLAQATGWPALPQVSYNETVYMATDKLEGVYLRYPDAKRFMNSYGKKCAARPEPAGHAPPSPSMPSLSATFPSFSLPRPPAPQLGLYGADMGPGLR